MFQRSFFEGSKTKKMQVNTILCCGSAKLPIWGRGIFGDYINKPIKDTKRPPKIQERMAIRAFSIEKKQTFWGSLSRRIEKNCLCLPVGIAPHIYQLDYLSLPPSPGEIKVSSDNNDHPVWVPLTS